jgi:signal transduction histidine kinase
MADLPRCLVDVTAPSFRNLESQIIREQTLGRGYSDEYEKECLCIDGARVNVSARSWLRRDEQGRPAGFWLMVRDITERKAADQRVLEYQVKLQTLMKDLAVAEERERQRIACDIHDRISQTLAACQMRLAAMVQTSESPMVIKETAVVSRLIEQTIRDTSSLIFELSPPMLHQLGLGPALEWFGEKLHEQHGIPVEVSGSPLPEPIAGDQRAALFRAACELMNNAAKHSRARSITVSLTWPAAMVRIEVRDDGRGFTPSESLWRRRDAGGFGLFHIRERLRAWGGSLQIESRPGAGTCAVMMVPQVSGETQI